MTYEEAYREYFSVIVKYCAYQVDNNLSCAEDIASEAFVTLYEKWDEFDSYNPRVILVWLYRAATFKVKEYHRKCPPDHIDLNDKKMENLIGKSLMENAFEFDGYEEFKKYERYISKIKSTLNESEWLLFDRVVMKKYSFKQIASEFKLSEAATKMRWYRLQDKIHPYVMKLLEKGL